MRKTRRQLGFCQFKLRGRKHIMLSCGCCDVFNLKWEYRMKMAAKEIKELL